MTKKLTFLFIYCFLAYNSLHAQTYVNINAAGSDDGSSWVNAFSNLDSALAETDTGEIWVAAGVYRHGASALDSFRTFYITSPVALYGGFAGTETTLGERDIDANSTVLSADFMNNDIDSRFDTLRNDNSFHVITVDSFITSPVILDGLTISGAQTGTDGNNTQYSRRGGGIYAWSTINVSNCKFKDNYARGATGIFLDPTRNGGSGSRVTNNLFINNVSINRGAGIYFYNQSDILIEGNTFTRNFVNAGCVYPFRSDNITIRNNTFSDNVGTFNDVFSVGVYIYRSTKVTIDQCTFSGNSANNATAIYFDADSTMADFPDNLVVTDCVFDNNTATGYGGTGIYLWQGVGVRVEDCIFSNNTSPNAAAVYQDGRQQVIREDNVVFKNCDFLNNTATDFGGGALLSFQASTTFDNCVISGNEAGNGAALFLGGDRGKIVNIKDCEISGNSSGAFGVVNLYGEDAVFKVTNTLFSQNETESSGGGIITGFLATTLIDRCTFVGNTSNNSGGGIRIQNDSTDVTISNSVFTENIAQTSAGAIFQTQGSLLTIDDSEFTLNSADIGGAISTSEDTVAGSFTMNNSIVQFNSATTQGGGINFTGNDAVITNSVINNNFNLNGISGGGIAGNAAGADDTIVISLINCTLADNEGPVGAGVGLWTDGNLGSATLTLQNTILANEGANYQIEDGTPVVISIGGNLSTDESLAGVFDENLGDLEEVTEKLFVDADDGDFHLVAGSPAINIGVEPAPSTDIEGSERVGPPDAGAYESQVEVSVKDILVANNDQLKVAPNPVSDQLNFILNNPWEGEMTVKLFGVNGRLLNQWQFDKLNGENRQSLSISNLPSGVYDLVVGDETKVVTTKVVKQ